MNFLTTYATRIYERSLYSNNTPIVEYLNETMSQVGRDIQSVVGRPSNTTNNNTAPSAQMTTPSPKSLAVPGRGINSQQNQEPVNPANITPETQEMFHKFLTFLQLNNQPATNGGMETTARKNGNSNGDHHFSS